jgi:predicted TIM-barrel fold metal-dependent hydrolase
MEIDDMNQWSSHGEPGTRERAGEAHTALPDEGATPLRGQAQAQVIDAHTHIFPRGIIERRVKIAASDEGFEKIYGNPRARMETHEALFGYMAREKVDASVVCGFPFKDKGLIRAANDYILEIAGRHKSIIPLASVNVTHEGTGIAEAERCLKSGARGIGEIALYEQGLSSEELQKLDEIATLAAQKRAPLLLHMNEQIGHHYDGKMVIDFAGVSRFIEAHQDLYIILAHLGGGLCFYEFMPEVKKTFSRVYYDIAALPYLYSNNVYRFIGQFIPEKCLFGSDFPLLSLKRYLEGVNTLQEETRKNILAGNLLRIFNHG